MLGDMADAHDIEALKNAGISQVLNVAYQATPTPEVQTLCVPLSDLGKSTLGDIFDTFFQFIDEARKQKNKVLVHCESGINRSPSIGALLIVVAWRTC